MKRTVFSFAFSVLASTTAYAFTLPPCSGATVHAENIFFHPGAPDEKPTPLQLAFTNALLENEARGGQVAYCMSDAHMTNGKNGLSFGFFQYDLARNRAAAGILADILGVVVDLPNVGLTKEDISTIRAGGLSQTAPVLRASTSNSKKRLIERVNQALATELGVAELNADFVLHIEKAIKSNDARVGKLTDKVGARTLLQSNGAARLLLLDYENFFGSFGEQFKGFLNGAPQRLTAGRIMIDAPASTTDIINFYLSGKQGSGPARDERAECLRRINNVLRYSEEAQGALVLTKRDKAYLTEVLKPILDGTDNPHIVEKRAAHQYDTLLKITERASKP